MGAGAALPSIVSALSGAERVIVTDYPGEEAERNLAYNLDINMEGEVRDRAVAIVSPISLDFVRPGSELMYRDMFGVRT